MRALVVNPHRRSIELVDRPAPRAPQKDEVLLRVLEVGICGTDRQIGRIEYGALPAGADELVLGHEALAEVIAMGPEATLFQPGELVVPTVRRPCSRPRCAPCRAGRQDFCRTGEFTERGIFGADGFLADHVLEEERNLVAGPDELRLVGVLVEPLSVVCKAIEEYERLRGGAFDVPHLRALVRGAGPVGLLAAMTFCAMNCETYVYSCEPEDSPRAELIAGFSGRYICSERTGPRDLSGPVGAADVVFEAVGVPEVAWAALPVLAANGFYVLTGVPALGEPVAADLRRWMRGIVLRNQLIVGIVSAGPSALRQAVVRLEQFLALFPGSLYSLIRRLPLDQAPEAVKRPQGIKDVIGLV